MKNIFLFLLFSISMSHAQTPEEVARGLNTLQDPAPGVTCEKHLMTPDEAVMELNSPTKIFLGRGKIYGHDQNYSCVYKTNKAYVLYHNCMGNKREYNALDFEVIPFDGNIIGISMENNNIGLPSTLKRSQYNMNWAVNLQVTTAPGGNLSLSELNNFIALDPVLGSCNIGGTLKARDMHQSAACSGRIKDADTSVWEQKATSFWREPGEAWYQAIRESRRRMTSF